MRGLFAVQSATQAGLAGLLNNVYVFGLPKDYLETYREKVAAVTPEQVKNASRALFGTDNSVITIVGDWAKVKDQLADFKDVSFVDVDGKQSTAPVP
jgi:zinc protease